jgi:hypothetical protein
MTHFAYFGSGISRSSIGKHDQNGKFCFSDGPDSGRKQARLACIFRGLECMPFSIQAAAAFLICRACDAPGCFRLFLVFGMAGRPGIIYTIFLFLSSY